MEALGPELLANGDFEQSVGVGATSVIGPGWQSDYAMCGPSIFAAPCGGGTMAYFTTNAGQVTNASNNVIPVIGSRSLAVNVSNNLSADILRWTNIPLENGQTYRLTVTAAIMGGPFAVAIQINNGLNGTFPVTAPPGLKVWATTETDFVFTGPTGNYPVSLNSNSGALGGNDHTFDTISLRAVIDDEQWPTCCGTPFAEGCLADGHRWVMLGAEDGTVEIYDTDTGLLADPNDIVDCPENEFVTSRFVTLGSVANNQSGTSRYDVVGQPASTFVHSWHVRQISGVVQVFVNGDPSIVLDDGESIGAEAQDNRRLADNVAVITTNIGASAEIVVVRRNL